MTGFSKSLARLAPVVALSVWPASALAAEAADYDLTAAAVKMIGVLAIILAALIGGVWLMKRYLPGAARRVGGLSTETIELLGAFSLSPKRQLTLIKVAGRVLLLGVTDQSINLITEIDDPEELARLEEGDRASQVSFAGLIRKFGQGRAS